MLTPIYRQDGGGCLYEAEPGDFEPRLVTYWCRHKDVAKLEQRVTDLKMCLGIVLATLAMIVLGGCGMAPHIEIDEQPVHQPSGTKRVSFTWNPPCEGLELPCGGPWVDYLLDVKQRGGDWIFRMATPENTASVALQPGTWQIRVAARNEAGTVGPWSLPSDSYTVPAIGDRPDIHEEVRK